MSQPTRSTVAVIGTTGVGKSQLGIELSKALHGEVINADSMQVYKGLDIITNKVPENEREGVTHHLMEFLEPEDEYLVTQFVKDAAIKIQEVSERKSLPVLVGGTNYYVQSLLWPMSLISSASDGSSSEEEGEEKFAMMNTSSLYKELQKVDPQMAAKWHPGDRRKIAKSLKVYRDTGRPQSEIIKEQQQLAKTDINLRYKTIIFWLYADPPTLNQRLDERVDKMIETGLFDELTSLRRKVAEGTVNTPGKELEKYQRGIWQAIGYKEFDEYLAAIENGEKDSAILKSLKEQSVERMKVATRRYAKRQVQWIRNKLLPTIWNTQDTIKELTIPSISLSPSKSIEIYLLDATDLSKWDKNVKDIAIQVTRGKTKNKTDLIGRMYHVLTPNRPFKDFLTGNKSVNPDSVNSFASTFLSRQRDAE
ncbi:tRNA dimethylallyltransferase, mitochondrial [Umbelopsis sp. WA50703]